MFIRIFVTLIILIAFVLAILVAVLPSHMLNFAIEVTHFFEVMLPILAVGALVKYLFTFHDKS